MSNMSYCRFRNTLEDLDDCADNLEDECSYDEHRARIRLIKICKRIAAQFEDNDNGEDLDHTERE